MLVKFLKPYTVFKSGDTADMTKAKAAELKAQGIITDDPKEIRKKTDKSDKPDKTVVPTQKDTTVK